MAEPEGYTVSFMPGVMFRKLRDCTAHFDHCVIMVAVGDDYHHHVDRGDIEGVFDDDWCRGCGQMGCRATAPRYGFQDG